MARHAVMQMLFRRESKKEEGTPCDSRGAHVESSQSGEMTPCTLYGRL